MELTIMFLISCVITARLLEKKNMRVASVAYSVMFIFILVALVFLGNFPFVRDALGDLMGEYSYFSTRYILLEALEAPNYNLFILLAILLTFALQFGATAYSIVDKIVFFLKKINHEMRKWKDLNPPNVFAYTPDLKKRINLVFCRMLN